MKFWRYITIVYLIGLTLCFVSCCPSQKASERKIKRLVECNPSLVQKDTVSVLDTIISDSIRFNTDTILMFDTLRIMRDGARVTILRRDTIKQEIPIYVEVECPQDTIYREVKVPVDNIVVPERRTSKWKWALWALVLGFVLGVFIMAKRI